MSTITTNDGSTTHPYEQISNAGSEGIYRGTASTLANPKTLRVSHETSKAGGPDRHLVQFSRTDDDADGAPHSGSAHIVLAAPRDGVSKADLLLLLTELTTLVIAKFDDIYGGFQPTD